MVNQTEEKSLANVIAFGTAFTTIFIVSGSVTDPVNVTKFLSLGITGSICLGLLLHPRFLKVFKDSLTLVSFSVFFLSAGLFSVFFSESPISQGFYGTYGRNNGWISYFFLTILLLATSLLSRIKSIHLIIKSFLFAGLVNVIYCLWVISFGDFIGWTNPYGNILGTFGNPNFIGAFLGMFIAAYLAYGLGSSTNPLFKYSMVLVIPITAFEIVDSNAIQGRVVGASGVAIVVFFYLRSRYKSLITILYSLIIVLVGLFALLGALQIGPLTALIYKYSVSLRGQYWLAAWNTGEANPLTGVGMDGFGDWYRRSRDAHALEVPGVNTVVNAAHNVPLDMFAFGGWPLFISYLVIMALGGWALGRSVLRSRSYDPTLAVLTSVWVGYQLQSIISINQIGLAIWGWVITGAAISYEKITRPNQNKSLDQKPDRKSRRGTEEMDLRGIPAAIVFGLVGFLLTLPPFASDVKWRSSQNQKSLKSLEDTMNVSYFNPLNNTKFLMNIQILEQSQLFALSRQYALRATNWNPEAFELWRTLYYIKNSTPEDKSRALANMRRLDPLNPELEVLK